MSGWCSARLCAWLSIAAITAAPVPVRADGRNAPTVATATPIQHLVVIFQENISFDHYFATYPFATNPPGEPAFYAYPTTPSVNGLSAAFLTNNANATNTANSTGATAPFRLDRSQAATADQDHNYLAEQLAYHSGL